MLLSAMAGLAGALVASLAGWVAWPAALVLGYMLNTAELLSRCLYEEFGSHLVGFAEVVIYAG